MVSKVYLNSAFPEHNHKVLQKPNNLKTQLPVQHKKNWTDLNRVFIAVLKDVNIIHRSYVQREGVPQFGSNS